MSFQVESGSVDWASIRQDFPILDQQVEGHPLVYLDNAATSHKPRAVVQAVVDFYQRDNSNVHRGLHELSARATQAYENARARTAAFLNAGSADEIIFTRGTTEAVNLVAQVFARQFFKAGDVILITGMEHHSNLVPWQMAARGSGATLLHIPVLDDGTLDFEELERLLTPQVRLFAFTHISNSLGTINPVADLCRQARAVGAVSFVDGAQSAGHMPVDVQAIGCDFYAFSGHKMCAPTGIGALFGRRELLERMEPWHGGGEMIETVSMESSTYKAPPQRFEAGTPNIAGAVGMAAAMEYLDALGRRRIWEHDLALTRHALDRCSEVPGLRVLGPRGDRGALVAFTLDVAHPHDIVTFANSRGVALRGGHHCTQPLMRRFKVPATARASFYFYNTIEEIDRLIDVLIETRQFFA